MFQYSICDVHFGIMKSELIFVWILEVFSAKGFFLHSARRQIPLVANKKKDLVWIELTFLQEVSIIVSVKIYRAA